MGAQTQPHTSTPIKRLFIVSTQPNDINFFLTKISLKNHAGSNCTFFYFDSFLSYICNSKQQPMQLLNWKRYINLHIKPSKNYIRNVRFYLFINPDKKIITIKPLLVLFI